MSVNAGTADAPSKGLHVLAPLAWRMLVLGVLLLAAYLCAGRVLLAQIPMLRAPLLERVNQRLPFEVEVSDLSGRWMAFSPELHFSGLRLFHGASDSPPVVLGSGSLRIDVPASLASGTLQLSRLRIAGLALEAKLRNDGSIEVIGFSGGGDGALRAWLEEFLPNVERVELVENQLQLSIGERKLDLALDLSLAREGNSRRLEGRVSSRELTLLLNARGVGNPLRPLSWRGDVYVDARSGDLSAFGSLLETLDWPFSMAGEASGEFWLTRADGDSTARMRWNSEALRLDERGGAWSLPLDALSFEAALDQRSRHWSLLTEDFHIEHAGEALDLDRAQFDWWGQALRVRASDLSLAALPTLLAAAPGVPEGLRQALPELAPAGQLSAIELRLDDLAQPGSSWQMRSVIDELSLHSWRNAPALEGVSGYLELAPNSGSLWLDAQSFSMHYPSVYREPLRYENALGDVNLYWDAEGLRIDSGLMLLKNQDGTAHGLFAVDIPFRERVTGIELELLIGLQDSRLEQNTQYLPFTLPGPLLSWLGNSRIEGDLQRAGFLWRGSVRRDNPEHKALQLFIDADNASLQYDPAWPSIDNASATVWIDDGRTWARADEARSSSAMLSELMVSVMPRTETVTLSIEGSVDSDAATAGLLLRDSPLREATNAIFADWQFEGRVQGDLALEFVLDGEALEPVVDLSLELQNVSAMIAQADLWTKNAGGTLRYRSEQGFLGTQAQAEALGGSFTLAAKEGEPELFEFSLEGGIETEALAEWLDLPLLRFAQGLGEVQGELSVSAARGSALVLQSDLRGVALDAPRPYGKSAAQPLPMQLSVPLTAEPRLQLSLGDRLRMQLELGEQGLNRLVAAVGGAAPNDDTCDQRYCLSGKISTLDIAQWNDFYGRYIETATAEQTASTLGVGETPAEQPFSYRIDSLAVGELNLASRRLGRSRIDLWGTEALWQGALESAALQGSLSRRNEQLQLLLEYIDIGRFSEGEPTLLAELRALIPDMRVDVLEVRDGAQVLGTLGFDLDMSTHDQALYAANIEGDLMGLRLAEPQNGLLRWSDKDGIERTELELDVRFGDVGGVLSAAGFEPTLETEAGSASLRLQWPGVPSEFELAAASGAVTMSARNGRVLEARPGALAMVSVLNLAEILRGLSLAHMFDAGIPFITSSAEVYLHSGTLEIAELHIDGAASAFAFNGLSDLKNGSINGELLVTLPVANNLPWVAALAAGLPVAAGVFVVSKVFQKQVNRMSSAVYGVSGDIQAPEVQFRRLFDDKLTPTPPVSPADNETGAG